MTDDMKKDQDQNPGQSGQQPGQAQHYEARGSALSVMAFSEVGTLLAPARILVRGAIMIRFGSWSAPSCRGLKSDSMDIVSLSL